MNNKASSALILLVPIAFFTSATASAQDIGLAAAAGDNQEIRIPVRAGHYVYEPFFSYRNWDNTDMPGFASESKTVSTGVGIWRMFDAVDNTYLQVGFQVGYTKQSSESSRIDISEDMVSGTSRKEQLDGYMIAPGLGFYYTFTPKIELGVEAKYLYKKLDGDRKGRDLNEGDSSWTLQSETEINSSLGTTYSQLVLRVYL